MLWVLFRAGPGSLSDFAEGYVREEETLYQQLVYNYIRWTLFSYGRGFILDPK